MREGVRRGGRARGLWLATALGVSATLLGSGLPARANEWTVQTGAHLDLWSGGGQRGHQVLAPFSLSFDTPDWGVSARSAFGTSERDLGGGVGSASFTGFTDTTVSGYYRLSVGKTEVRLGVDVDAPTGVSRLTARESLAVQDEDLVVLERFGEGLDVNPTVSVYHFFDGFGLGFGVGYLYTGKYDPTKDVPNDDLNPGDELAAALLGDLYVGDVGRLTARVAYTYYSADERSGADVYREGGEVDARVAFTWRPEPWWFSVAARDIVRFKAERLGADGRLRRESSNSYGNEIRGEVVVGYLASDAWEFRLGADVRHVAANDYPEGSVFHDGGRTKLAIGPAVTWSPTRSFAIDAGVRYFYLDAKRSLFFTQDSTIHGVHADFRITYRF